MSCECPDVYNPSGNDIQDAVHIPNKMGEPFSSLNERATIIGALPQVLRYPGFTLVNGGTIVNKMSNGGIQNLSAFFKSRTGAYYDKNAQLSAPCCP